jgi:tetrahydromethanopterin S-methyltransferase subunit G
MAVMMPRQNWTDERLDHFERRVEERFEHIEKRLDRMDADIRELRQAVTQVSESSMHRNFIALAMLVVAAVVFF